MVENLELLSDRLLLALAALSLSRRLSDSNDNRDSRDDGPRAPEHDDAPQRDEQLVQVRHFLRLEHARQPKRLERESDDQQKGGQGEEQAPERRVRTRRDEGGAGR